MTHLPKADCVARKVGSTTLEFIFCAPLLVMIMMVAMEINERIEQRVTSAIAAGNASWLVKPTTPNGASLVDFAAVTKSDILGMRNSPTDPTLKKSNDGVLTNSDVVMAYTDRKRRADAYGLKLSYAKSAQSTDRASKRASTTIGTSRSDELSSAVSGSASAMSALISKFTNPPVAWLPTVFPTSEVEEQRLTWSVSASGTTNVAITTIERLARLINSDTSQNLANPHAKEYRLLAHHSTYLRRDPAFHPNAYTNSALFGMIIGNSDFSEFNEKCFMKLNVKSEDCGEKNGFVGYLQKIAGILILGKTYLDYGVISCIVGSFGMGSGVCVVPKLMQTGVETVLNEAIDAVIKKVTDEIKDQVTGAINTIAARISGEIENEIERHINDIQGKIQGAAAGMLHEEPEP